MKILQHAKEAGLGASLTFTTRGGKMKAKLEVELDHSVPVPNASSRKASPPTWSRSKSLPQSAGTCPPAEAATRLALYPESFCDKNHAIRKVFAFSDSGRVGSSRTLVAPKRKHC